MAGHSRGVPDVWLWPVACGVRVKEDRVGIVRYERVEVKNEGLRCTRVKSGRIIRLPRPSLPILQ